MTRRKDNMQRLARTSTDNNTLNKEKQPEIKIIKKEINPAPAETKKSTLSWAEEIMTPVNSADQSSSQQHQSKAESNRILTNLTERNKSKIVWVGHRGMGSTSNDGYSMNELGDPESYPENSAKSFLKALTPKNLIKYPDDDEDEPKYNYYLRDPDVIYKLYIPSKISYDVTKRDPYKNGYPSLIFGKNQNIYIRVDDVEDLGNDQFIYNNVLYSTNNGPDNGEKVPAEDIHIVHENERKIYYFRLEEEDCKFSSGIIIYQKIPTCLGSFNIIAENYKEKLFKYENSYYFFDEEKKLKNCEFLKKIDGIDAIELDIYLNKDKVPIVIHDDELYKNIHFNQLELEKLNSRKKLDYNYYNIRKNLISHFRNNRHIHIEKVQDKTLEELKEYKLDKIGERIPSLTEILDLVYNQQSEQKRNILINIELKDKNKGTGEAVSKTIIEFMEKKAEETDISEYKGLTKANFIMISFEHNILKEFCSSFVYQLAQTKNNNLVELLNAAELEGDLMIISPALNTNFLFGKTDKITHKPISSEYLSDIINKLNKKLCKTSGNNGVDNVLNDLKEDLLIYLNKKGYYYSCADRVDFRHNKDTIEVKESDNSIIAIKKQMNNLIYLEEKYSSIPNIFFKSNQPHLSRYFEILLKEKDIKIEEFITLGKGIDFKNDKTRNR